MSECESAYEKEIVHKQKESYEKNQERHKIREEKGEYYERMHIECKNKESAHAKGEISVHRVVKQEVKGNFYA